MKLMGFGGPVVCVGVYLWHREIRVGVKKYASGGFHEATQLPRYTEEISVETGLDLSML